MAISAGRRSGGDRHRSVRERIFYTADTSFDASGGSVYEITSPVGFEKTPDYYVPRGMTP